MTALRLDVPSSPDQLLLWAHVCFVWIAVNYVHRLDPVGRADARSLDEATLSRWRAGVLVRAAAAGSAATALAGFDGMGFALGGLVFAGGGALPLARLRWMRSDAGAGRDLRAEWELLVNALVLGVSALLVGAGTRGLAWAVLEVPAAHEEIVAALVMGSGALFLLRGGTHVVRGVLEKTDTLPDESAAITDDELRHGVTIGNIERLLIYVFALTGSHAAIALVIAAKGVVRAVEWRGRTLVEYFLIGTLASAGLAAVVGIGLRWSLSAL